MTSRSAKRRRYSNMKNLLVNDLNNINITSAELNEDIRSANEDFGLFFKSMEDMQSELFARSLGIEEKYMNLINVLAGKQSGYAGFTSDQSSPMDIAYMENERKFVEDTNVSLIGHMRQLKEYLEEMMERFRTFNDGWKEKLGDCLLKAVKMEEDRVKLGARLTEFSRNI